MSEVKEGMKVENNVMTLTFDSAFAEAVLSKYYTDKIGCKVDAYINYGLKGADYDPECHCEVELVIEDAHLAARKILLGMEPDDIAEIVLDEEE